MLARGMSHQTLGRWEIRMRAALNACAKQVVAKAVYEVASHAMSGDSGWRLLITQYRRVSVTVACETPGTDLHSEAQRLFGQDRLEPRVGWTPGWGELHFASSGAL